MTIDIKAIRTRYNIEHRWDVSGQFRQDIITVCDEVDRMRALLETVAKQADVFEGCQGACAIGDGPCDYCWEHDGIKGMLREYGAKP